MSKVTGKFQITLPKRLAETYGIRVGDELELVAAGETISIVPARAKSALASPQQRLQNFDEATRRQQGREKAQPRPTAKDRGWTRESLYGRGRPR